jgi:hypothetical protein
MTRAEYGLHSHASVITIVLPGAQGRRHGHAQDQRRPAKPCNSQNPAGTEGTVGPSQIPNCSIIERSIIEHFAAIPLKPWCAWDCGRVSSTRLHYVHL